MNKRIVIIPTYNEIENIEAILLKVLSLDPVFDVLIVDDGSPDGTAQQVKRLQKANDGRIHLLERKGKLGLGTAYIEGFKIALAKGYDFLFEMDADFSHDPTDLERLFEACYTGGADMAVGEPQPQSLARDTFVRPTSWGSSRPTCTSTRSLRPHTCLGMLP